MWGSRGLARYAHSGEVNVTKIKGEEWGYKFAHYQKKKKSNFFFLQPNSYT